MTTAPTLRAVVAATRFGFAARAEDLRSIAGDPRGWALRQLARPPAAAPAGLPPAAVGVTLALEARRDKELKPETRQKIRAIFLAEVEARLDQAIDSDTPLLERLVHFWSNHFTVSVMRPLISGFAGAFEREAIRPHVTGRFAEMLLAVVRHPAMQLYLDNAISIGPDSVVGQRRNRGLNENLGRELLELHTLGVDGGYGQADVEALARILTGWTVARLNDPDPGTFRFAPRIHEPGPKILLGRLYPESGETEGLAALDALAHHPATARHIALKLARHFIADEPPPDAVLRIARSFRDSGGDLRAVIAAVIAEDAAWSEPFAKLRTPSELVISACRVTATRLPAEAAQGNLRLLDQPCFLAPSPAGWPDTAAAWAAPEAVLRRTQWCQAFVDKLPDPPDPLAVAEASFGGALTDETRLAVSRASSRRMGLALLIASPEFQRR